jgi:rhamnogalacturonan acetylesterase
VTSKGAKVIIPSTTTDYPCETLPCSYIPNTFPGYCKDAVANVGSGATFVDHGQNVANEFISLGATAVDSYYLIDYTYTNLVGANVVAAAFVKGLLCEGNPLTAAHGKNNNICSFSQLNVHMVRHQMTNI